VLDGVWYVGTHQHEVERLLVENGTCRLRPPREQTWYADELESEENHQASVEREKRTNLCPRTTLDPCSVVGLSGLSGLRFRPDSSNDSSTDTVLARGNNASASRSLGIVITTESLCASKVLSDGIAVSWESEATGSNSTDACVAQLAKDSPLYARACEANVNKQAR
jgi:hypothetical protein